MSEPEGPAVDPSPRAATQLGWDPMRYLRFADLRHRPALDLLARIDGVEPGVVHDVGCGTGTLTRALAHRWAEAKVIGSDSSAEMLAEASATDTTIEWRRLDVRRWDPAEEADVITANAVLHWVPGHDELILRLFGSVRPGGALAIQMPRSWHEPSHLLMRDLLRTEGLGSEDLHRRLATPPVAEPEHYYRLLSPQTSHLDVWETRYLQTLSGADPVLEWMGGTALRPVLDELADAEQAEYLNVYAQALRKAYPPGNDGITLFPFPRLFLVARR